MIRSQYLAVALALAVGGTACDSSADPFGPSDSLQTTDGLDVMLATASGTRTDDGSRGGRASGVALFDALAAEIPGFAGLYRTRQCAVVVVLTAEGDRAQALPVVRRMLAPLVTRPCSDGFSLAAQGGEFSYIQLKRYLAAARPVATMRGVDRPRIDFQLNRLVIPVASREIGDAVLARLVELGIPARAVVIVAA